MTDLKSKNLQEIREFVIQHGYPKYRAEQLFAWIQSRGVRSFDEMTDLPKEMIVFLKENACISMVAEEEKFVSAIDGTVKYLYRLNDGNFVETVVMKYRHGYSVCLSSQVGCRMGCAFCQSTKGGKIRDLAPSEILDQMMFAEHDLGIRIGNIVLMGIGEPLDNFDNVMRFLELVGDPKGRNIGYRHISLSTCGLAPEIRKLAEYGYPVTLSVSLHAPFDDMRNRLMPINRKYDIATLMKAVFAYQAVTTRRISFEYTMIRGVNDTPSCAAQLVKLLKGKLCHVNLIPVNKIRNGTFDPSEKDNIKSFQSYLVSHGVNATVRRTLGADISASCGQLRSRKNEKEGNL